MSQFVPLKIDTGSKEFREWSKDHKSEGNAIPILYVVRADGETLYGQSGSLTGDKLPTMLMQALRHSGKVLTPQEAKVAVESIDKFDKLFEEGEIESAVKALNKVKRLGNPGQIESYASPVVRINQAVKNISDDVSSKMADQLKAIRSDDESQQLEAILSSFQLKRDFGALRALKTQFTKFARELAQIKSLKTMVKEARIIDSAMTAKSRSSINRSSGKLQELIDGTSSKVVRSIAQKELDALKKKLAK